MILKETLFLVEYMCNTGNDVVIDIIKYEPAKVGSNLYEKTAKRFAVYVRLGVFALATFDWRQ